MTMFRWPGCNCCYDAGHHVTPLPRRLAGSQTCAVVGDMLFMSYKVSTVAAVRKCAGCWRRGGWMGEIGRRHRMADTRPLIVRAGILLMGHIGLTLQTVSQLALSFECRYP
ncbi:MAG: 3-methyl-2-oxobutanoate hydroxymethyltransferase [Ardenticatenaceae bacterium]|nr:3-methyl-2-oxobutanoate hydroxymethyltransferase [Ardenticatenaceae bacterium]